METLKGKNILITGAAGGIGSALVKILAGSGAVLFLAGRSKDKLLKVAGENGVPPERIFSVDLSKPEEVEKLKEQYFNQLASIDILVNAAGIVIIK